MRWWLSLVLIGITLVGTAPVPARADYLPWQDKTTPFGVVATLGNRVRSDEIPAAVALLREAGVQWQREEIFWHEVQQTPGGPYDWDGNAAGRYNYDLAIEAQVAAGIDVLGLLDYNPAWFKGKNPRPEEWLDDWGDFVYQTVARYGRDRGWIKYWELWNEPNLSASGYESGLYTIADYVRLVEVGRTAALAADPEAKIVLGGLAAIWSEPPSPHHYDYFDYLEQFAAYGGWQHIDVIAIHPYRPDAPEGAAWRRDRSFTLSDELHRLDQILLKHGPRPIWITELGWSTSRAWPGVDPDTQAFYLVRAYLLAITHPSVEKVFWYDFRNDTDPDAAYNRPTYNPNEVEFHYGLLRRTYPLNPNDGNLRKPAFVAFRTLTSLLGGLYLDDVVRQGRDPALPGVFWYRFAGGERRVDLLWRVGDDPEPIQVRCDCREALVRSWNGEVLNLITAADGMITLRLRAPGAPMYVEYDPPTQPGGRIFPATGHSIRGAFQRFWEANGGLERFGYPLTEELIEPEHGSGRPRTVQYFERARLEHFPELSGTPFEVQLARLGDALLQREGIDWQRQPRAAEGATPPDCRFFPETGRFVCPPLLSAWEAAGGLTLAGLPLTNAYPLTDTPPGTTIIAQYFERVRIEEHRQTDGTVQIRFGLLGRELIGTWGAMP